MPKKSASKKKSQTKQKYLYLVLAILGLSLLAGTGSAIFLHGLYFVTDLRDQNLWMVALLPVGGLLIGFIYHKYGEKAVKGNDLVISEYLEPSEVLPKRMAPMVLIGTWVTHLFGGSAGREGTAVQMGGVFADLFARYGIDRKLLMLMGTAAGFASVFGTPWAGLIFAFEVVRIDSVKLNRLLPVAITSILADQVSLLWGVHHSDYRVAFVPALTASKVGWTILVGIGAGLVAMYFAWSNRRFKKLFARYVPYPPLRPVVGGVIFAILFFSINTERYLGLGIPVIQSAFDNILPWYDFAVKTILTTFTLGAGFKGGEVTPLFFVGATFGNFLSTWIPLPLMLLAGVGFVAVFSGATNTPLACTVMGIELFGMTGGVYFFIGCMAAYIFSGQKGIYHAQPHLYLKIPWEKIFKRSSVAP
jgi:H+/Cl- antiporter ClcA